MEHFSITPDIIASFAGCSVLLPIALLGLVRLGKLLISKTGPRFITPQGQEGQDSVIDTRIHR